MRPAPLYGLARSLVTYYGQPWRNARRRAFYGQFVAPGALCFDVGAHVGDRVRTFTQLGARVVAVEPQPAMLRVLRWLYGRAPSVTLVPAAVGDANGTARLHVSSRTPTVATLSRTWMDEVRRDPRFASITWDHDVEVDVVTLDALIERFGEPAFCKIDVEGLELDVLRGLTRPLAALSFEYIPVAKERALACLERVADLGDYELRTSPVETTRWAQPGWMTVAEARRFLSALPVTAGSGDIYARRRDR